MLPLRYGDYLSNVGSILNTSESKKAIVSPKDITISIASVGLKRINLGSIIWLELPKNVKAQ